MNNTTLLLITSAFPANTITEPTFIMPELRELSKQFKEVIIMPMLNLKDKEKIDLSEFRNVKVSTKLSEFIFWKHKWLRGLLLFHPIALRALLNGRIEELTYSLSTIAVTKAIKSLRLNPKSTLLYSYWFESQAAGAALSGLPTIIRAHGHDVWTTRGVWLRRKAVGKSKGLFVVSEAGRDYLKEQLPGNESKIEIARLGSRKIHTDMFSKGHKASDHKLTFLTTARSAPEKRLHLIYEFVKAIAVARPSTKVKWIYAGDGPLFDELKSAISADTLTDNLIVDIRGALSNREIHDLYISEPIDWNIMLSTTEGLPISLCESLSYGVPVVTTEVGGIPELIDDTCGVLLPKDPEKEEFVRGLVPYLDSDFRMNQLREGAFQRWKDMADASERSRNFAEKIANLCK